MYPIASAQDAEGRQTELRTWRDETGLPDVTRWFRDQMSGLVTNKVYADGKGPAYAYLPDGRVSTRLWARGVAASYGWQDTAAGRVVGVGYSDGTPAVTNTYDLANRLTRVEDGTGARTFRYDAQGRLLAETNALAVITRRYDAQGMASEFIVDNDPTIAYAYDDLMRLTNVNVGGLTFGCAYLPQTRMQVSASNSCGSGWSRSYEGGRNLIAAVTNFQGANLLASYAYGNDALGRRAVRNGDTFAYNARSELTNATVSADVYGYGYDGIGNLLFSAVGTATNTYAANALNQYTNILCAPASLRLDYDLDGNMLTNGVWAYTWDAENRLNSVEADGVPLVSNAYDYLGRRFRKTSGAVTRSFAYDGWNLCREVEASGGVAVTNIYVWGLDLSGTVQGAGGVGGLLAVLRNGTPYFPCYDANGNVTDYVNAGGAVVAHREYDPFGRTTAATGALVHELHFWFSTKYLDEETGLYYYGYRFYAPERMRWLSRDPIKNRGSWNLYAFVENDTINAVDPDGRAIWPFNRRRQPEYEIVVQGTEPTFPKTGVWMCQEELVGKKVMGILHHRFVVFDGDARGFEKRTRWLWGGEGGVRDESQQPLHNDVSCYEMKCLKKDCARQIFNSAVSSGQGQRYWLGYRDCQSWANNVERSMYKECDDCNCSKADRDSARRNTWKYTGFRTVTLANKPEPDLTPWPPPDEPGSGFPLFRF